nr:hypothetical protein CFP56_24689 [Quercus suber]
MGSMEKIVDSLRVKWPRCLGLRRGFGPIGKGSLMRGGNEVFGGRGMEERHVVQMAWKWRTSVRVSMHFAIFSSRSRLRPDHWAASPLAHSLPFLQSIVTAARYQSTQGQASLFAITVVSMIETHVLRDVIRL